MLPPQPRTTAAYPWRRPCPRDVRGGAAATFCFAECFKNCRWSWVNYFFYTGTSNHVVVGPWPRTCGGGIFVEIARPWAPYIREVWNLVDENEGKKKYMHY
jgi:hypothetical protein